MNLIEAVEVLKNFQSWRLGAKIPMQEPKLITEAIDTLLAHHRPQEKPCHVSVYNEDLENDCC